MLHARRTTLRMRQVPGGIEMPPQLELMIAVPEKVIGDEPDTRGPGGRRACGRCGR